MKTFIHSHRASSFSLSAEHRLLHFAGIDDMPGFTQGGKEEVTKFRDWKAQTPGAEALFDAFAETQDATQEGLREYINGVAQRNGGTLTPFESEISMTLTRIHVDSDPKEAIKAEAKIQKLIDVINSRSRVLQDAQDKRGEFQKQEELPYVTRNVLDFGKNVIGSTYEGFNSSTGSQKVLMLAGLTAGVMVLRGLYKSIDPKSPYLRGAVGLTAAVILAEGVNVAVHKTRGVPLYNWEDGSWRFPLGNFSPLGSSPEQFAEKKKADTLEKAYAQLQNTGIPDGFLNQIGITGQQKEYAIGINNLADLSIPQFQNLYENHKGSRQIPDEASDYAIGSIAQDHLTPRQRYELVLTMGQGLGLIDTRGNFMVPTDPHRLDKKLMYLMLDWHV